MRSALVWRSKSIASTVTHVPASPGIYVLGKSELFEGLELKRTYVYVGKTLNMRRRLQEHTHLTELHPDLAEYMRRERGSITVWYTTDVLVESVDALERALIRHLEPRFNRIKYAKGKGQ